MQITREAETAKGPSESFTGDVYIDSIAAPQGPSRTAAARVHFMPGARTAWHTHPFGQTIHILEGTCLCQRRGGPVETIEAGQSVYFEPDEDHWHGASPDRLMTHIAIQEAGEDGPVKWGEHVTDEEYAGRG